MATPQTTHDRLCETESRLADALSGIERIRRERDNLKRKLESVEQWLREHNEGALAHEFRKKFL